MSKGKRLLTMLLVVLCLCMLSAFVACTGDGDSSGSGSSQPIDSGDSTGGSSGGSSVDPDPDPDPDPIDAVLIGEIPVTKIKTQATADGKTAEASWFANYTQDGIKFEVYVKDEAIYSDGDNLYSNDGVEIIVSKVQRAKGYTDGTISVAVDVNGKFAVKNLSTAATVENSGVTVKVEKFTFNQKTVAGYIADVVVPYSVTEATYENKDAAVAFGLTNANDAVSLTSVYDKTFGADYENVHTFVKIDANDAFAANDYIEYGMVWGNANDLLPASSVWNVDGDDGSETAHIYNTDVDNRDNYIYMRSSNLVNYYAEAKFSVKSLLNGELWGKFGFVVTTADGAGGFFYYVDAAAKDGVTINADSINLGFNNRDGVGAWAFNYQIVGSLGEDATSADYTGDNYITLGVYRQNGAFKLYANGNYIKTVSAGVGSDQEAYLGIASFNITMDVKEYKIVTEAEKLDDYRISSTDKDYLFIGDSYIDKAFWYTYGDVFGEESAANEGVGATKVPYWLNMVGTLRAMYNPQNIIMHIGVNDIDSGVTAEDTNENIDKLFTSLKNEFPNANIYYVGLVHNMLFTQFHGEYDAVNAHVSSVAENDEKINYIDMNAIITPDANGSTMKWFSPDGLHYGLDGYAAFDKAICKALGVTRDEGAAGLGDLVVDGAPAFTYSSGWNFEEDNIAHHTGRAEAQLYFADVYHADFYAEAKISIAGTTFADDFPKAGLAFRSERGLWFWAIDLAKGSNSNGTYYNNGWSQVYYRPEVMSKDWDWSGCWKVFQWVYNNQYPKEYPGGSSFDYTTDKSYITLGIAKVGTDAWFISEGKVVNVINGLFEKDEKVSAAIVNFNLEMYAKDAVAITDKAELKAKLDSLKIYERTKEIDGDISDWTEEQLSNPVVIPATEGREVKIYSTLASDGMYIFYDVIHNTYVNNLGDWFLNTNLEFRLADGLQRFASASGLGSRWEFATRQIGDFKFVTQTENGKQHTKAEIFVPYSMIDGYDKDSTLLPAGFAWKTGGETGTVWGVWNGTAWADGDFWYVPEADPGMRNILVTQKGIKTASLRTIDGDASDWAEDTFTDFACGGGQYSAFLGSDGMYMFYKLSAKSIAVNNTNTAGNWWQNVNLEFFATDNTYAARIMMYGGKLYHTGYVTDAAAVYTDGESEDTLYIELFIANENLKGVTADSQSVKVDIGGQFYPNGWKDFMRDGFVVSKK